MKDLKKSVILTLLMALLMTVIFSTILIVKDIENEADMKIPVTLIVPENNSIIIYEIGNYIKYLNTNVTGKTKNSAIDKIGYDIVETKEWNPPECEDIDYNFGCSDSLLESITKLNNTIIDDGIVVIIVNKKMPGDSLALTWPDRTFRFGDKKYLIIEYQGNDDNDYNNCKEEIQKELSIITTGFIDEFIERYS